MSIHIILRTSATIFASLQLIACEKSPSSESGQSSSESEIGKIEAPSATRVDRSRKNQKPSENQQLRDALDDALAIEDAESRVEAVGRLAWEAVDSNPDLFKRAFDLLPSDSTERTALIQTFVVQLAQESPDIALQWADSLGTPLEKDSAKSEIIQFLAASDPKRAIQILGRPSSGDSELGNTTVYLIHRLSAESPADAASWVATFPAGKARQAALGTVASDWVQTDAAKAFSWLASLENPVLRDEAFQGVLKGVSGQPEDIRVEWLTFADSTTRAEIERLVEEMKPIDEDPSFEEN